MEVNLLYFIQKYKEKSKTSNFVQLTVNENNLFIILIKIVCTKCSTIIML